MEKKYTRIENSKLRKLYRREKQMRRLKTYVREVWHILSRIDETKGRSKINK